MNQGGGRAGSKSGWLDVDRLGRAPCNGMADGLLDGEYDGRGNKREEGDCLRGGYVGSKTGGRISTNENCGVWRPRGAKKDEGTHQELDNKNPGKGTAGNKTDGPEMSERSEEREEGDCLRRRYAGPKTGGRMPTNKKCGVWGPRETKKSEGTHQGLDNKNEERDCQQ